MRLESIDKTRATHENIYIIFSCVARLESIDKTRATHENMIYILPFFTLVEQQIAKSFFQLWTRICTEFKCCAYIRRKQRKGVLKVCLKRHLLLNKLSRSFSVSY